MNRIVTAAFAVCFGLGLWVASHAQQLSGGGAGSGTPGGSNTQLQYNNSGAFGGTSGVTFDGTGQVSIALGTITANTKALNITGTFNNSGVTFDAPLFMNITNTASAFQSLLADFQVGGTSVFTLTRNGDVIVTSGAGGTITATGVVAGSNMQIVNGDLIFRAAGNHILGGPTVVYGFGSTNDMAGQNNDTGISRGGAANVLAFGNGNATDTSAYFRYGGQSRVSSQFDKTSSTALANITGLSVNVAAGRTYEFRATLYTTSAVTGGVKAAIAGTATATAIIYQGKTTNSTTLGANDRATTLGAAVGGITAVTVALIEITGTITVNAAGTLTVQFAQNASDATASSVLVGSVFIVNDVT